MAKRCTTVDTLNVKWLILYTLQMMIILKILWISGKFSIQRRAKSKKQTVGVFLWTLNPIVDDIYEFVCYSKTTKNTGSKKTEGVVFKSNKASSFYKREKNILKYLDRGYFFEIGCWNCPQGFVEEKPHTKSLKKGATPIPPLVKSVIINHSSLATK